MLFRYNFLLFFPASKNSYLLLTGPTSKQNRTSISSVESQSIPAARIEASRPSQQSLQTMQHRFQGPTQTAAQWPLPSNSQLKPRTSQSPAARPPGMSVEWTGSARHGTAVPTVPLNTNFNNAPLLKSASELYSANEHPSKANPPSIARPVHNMRPPFFQRDRGLGPRQAPGQDLPNVALVPSINANNQAQRMQRPNEDRTAFTEGGSRFPSLVHQRDQPSVVNYKQRDCRNFPNCRFKTSCHNRHPQCPGAL